MPAEIAPAEGSDTYSLAEVARKFGISRATAYRRANEGNFPVPVLRVGSLFRVPKAPVDRLLRGEVSPAVGEAS